MAKKVLLVEYEPRYLQRLNSVLQEKGWEIQIAKDGEEALSKLEGFAPDLVFISAVLPKVRTAEVIKAIKSKEELKNTRIVLLATGIKEDLIEVEKKKKEVDHILCKPFSETKIIECLDTLAPQPAPEKKEEGILDLVPKPEKKLTSEDLFGEFIEEKPQPPKPEKKEEVEDLLHKTLSSIGTEKPKKTEAVPKIETDIDKKLTETLSGIQIPTKPKKTVQIPKEEPAKIIEEKPKVEEPKPKVEEVKPKIEEAKPKVEVKKEEPKVVEKIIEEVKLKEKPKEEEIPAPEEKEERFGNYILIEKLGTGGMAEIYKAKMEGVEGFQKLVAIKRILPQFSHNKDFTTMFIDEAKVAAQLSHRNIVHIYDLGKIENSYFIAMEYMEGTDLRKVMHEAREKNEKVPIPIALFVVSQVASALDYAHNKKDHNGKPLNIVHRDVSPQNILISKDGEIKICDFGIAKAASKASHTRAGSLKGKLQYMSPEQAWGKAVDFKSDIFSLGVVLYEALTGKHLFEGDSELSILEKVRHPKVEPLSKTLKDFPKELENIISKALKENPEERYPDANSFKKDVEEILSRYEPKVTEKVISEYLLYLEGKKEKFLTFTYKPPVEKVKEEVVVKEEIPKIKEPEKVVEKKPEKEELPLKPPEIKMPEKKIPTMLEEEKGEGKKFPLWIIGAGAAVLLIIIGILFLATGKKPAETPPPAPVETKQEETTAQPAVEVPAPTTETPKTEPAKKEETKKPEEKPKPVEEKKPEEKPVAVEQKPKETPLPKTETPPPAETLPEKKEPVEEVKKPEPVVETPPPPTPAVEEKKPPEKKETPSEKPVTYNTGDLVPAGTPGLTPPKKISDVAPVYPPIAKMQKLKGNVDVRVLVDEKGNVIEAVAISGNPVFKAEAENAARKTKFAPAEINGVKVKCYYTLTFKFQ